MTAAAQRRIMQMTFDYGCGETGGEVVVVVVLVVVGGGVPHRRM